MARTDKPDPFAGLLALQRGEALKPRFQNWKPPCLICDAPNPAYGVETRDDVGARRTDWFCREHLPPDFWKHRDAARAAGGAP